MKADYSGSNNNHWKGGKKVSTWGYRMVLMPEHPRAEITGYVREHILLAEKALGKPLPVQAIVHHANGDKCDNKNLVICESGAYHKLLHVRMKAYKACGHANWLKCQFCGLYDDPNFMKTFYQSSKSMSLTGHHRECKTADKKRRKKHKTPRTEITITEFKEAP